MKTMNLVRKWGAALLAGAALTCALSTGAFAAEQGEAPTCVAVNFCTELKPAEGASSDVPGASFGYTVAPGTGVPASGGNLEILAGVGQPKVQDVVFTAGGEDSKLSNVDFSGVQFAKPGIYRYVITAKPTDNPDITNDSATTRILDVYVVNDGKGGFCISAFEVLKTPSTPDGSGCYPGEKNDTFVNVYKNYELCVEKCIQGNMADLNKKFDFTIELTGRPGATFTYEGKTHTLDQNGKASLTGVKLGNQESVKIFGLTSATSYTVTENISATEGYTTTFAVNGGKVQEGTKAGPVTMGKQNNGVQFTNTKDSVTPTGLAMDAAPYLCMVALAVAAAFLLRRKPLAE